MTDFVFPESLTRGLHYVIDDEGLKKFIIDCGTCGKKAEECIEQLSECADCGHEPICSHCMHGDPED